MDFFWGLLLGFVVGVFYMADRSNVDKRTDIE
jgi:hypothetical protein